MLHANGIKERVDSLGFAFISADHQLFPASNGHDILKDVQDLVSFIKNNAITSFDKPIQLDADNYAISGAIAGGFIAYLAVVHVWVPKHKYWYPYATRVNALSSAHSSS